MTIPISDCEICSQLSESQSSFSKYGWDDSTRALPAAAGRLVSTGFIAPYDREENHLERCPVCGIFYHYRSSYEYLVNGSEDEEILTRLTPAECRAFLAEGEYERLLAHHLALGELAAVEALLCGTERDVVYGALDFLVSQAAQDGLPPETAALRSTVTRLAASPDQAIAGKAGYLLKYGLPGD